MFKIMQWSTLHFVMIPLSMLFMPLLILVVHQDYSQYSDYIAPFSWIFFPLLWFFLIKRGLSLRRSERAEQVAFLNKIEIFGSLKNSKKLAQEFISLPLWEDISKQQIEDVVEELERAMLLHGK
jgi:hypothetical protein